MRVRVYHWFEVAQSGFCLFLSTNCLIAWLAVCCFVSLKRGPSSSTMPSVGDLVVIWNASSLLVVRSDLYAFLFSCWCSLAVSRARSSARLFSLAAISKLSAEPRVSVAF